MGPSILPWTHLPRQDLSWVIQPWTICLGQRSIDLGPVYLGEIYRRWISLSWTHLPRKDLSWVKLSISDPSISDGEIYRGSSRSTSARSIVGQSILGPSTLGRSLYLNPGPAYILLFQPYKFRSEFTEPRRGDRSEFRRGDRSKPRRGDRSKPRRGDRSKPRRGDRSKPPRIYMVEISLSLVIHPFKTLMKNPPKCRGHP